MKQSDSSLPPHSLPSRQGKVIMPLSKDLNAEANPAADLIRQKIQQLYAQEPDAREEQQEVEHIRHRSKHQDFMHELTNSGKSLAEIQVEWHNYYAALPDMEKHQVWQEFYAAHAKAKEKRPPHAAMSQTDPEPEAASHVPKQPAAKPALKPKEDKRTLADIKRQLLATVQARQTSSGKQQHVKSLLFGLGVSSVVMFVMLFGFFNERFIAPFITPSRAISSTPLIIDPSTTAVGPEPKIIIPKINVEIPVVYDEPSIGEKAIQAALERGVVHYPTTPNPGELGNGVIFGHSANNILNKGKYKFAFVLLRRLEPGDTFYIHKDGKRYVYKVYEKKVVAPTEVSVLNARDKPATFTLITCDPPGTSLNRLVVVGEQISPDPSTNVPSSVAADQTAKPVQLPSNSPTLWSRIRDGLSR